MELMKDKYKQTEIGMIPLDWEIVNFSDIADKHKKWSITGGPFGSNLKASDYTTDGIQIIQLQNIGDGRFINESKVFTSVEKANELISCNIYPDDIILSKMGDPVTRACFIPSIGERLLMSSDGIRLVVNEKEFNKRFAHDYINSIYFRKRAIEISTGTTRQRIGLPELKSLKFIKPPLNEQTAIATALSDADAWISSLEKLIAKKRLVKQGAMQELLKPKEGWDEKSLGEIATIVRGASPRPIDNPIWFDDKSSIGWVRISDVTKSKKVLLETTQKLSMDGVRNSRLVESDNLIMSICATVGRPILTTFDVCIHDGFVVFRNPKVEKEFLYYFLSFIEEDWSKNGQTGSQMNLNTTLINTTEIYIPSIKEQIRIATILSDMDAELEKLEEKLAKAKQVKQGMMQELLTGRVRLI
jgi:type I restriction enzyme S subunit